MNEKKTAQRAHGIGSLRFLMAFMLAGLTTGCGASKDAQRTMTTVDGIAGALARTLPGLARSLSSADGKIDDLGRKMTLAALQRGRNEQNLSRLGYETARNGLRMQDLRNQVDVLARTAARLESQRRKDDETASTLPEIETSSLTESALTLPEVQGATQPENIDLGFADIYARAALESEETE